MRNNWRRAFQGQDTISAHGLIFTYHFYTTHRKNASLHPYSLRQVPTSRIARQRYCLDSSAHSLYTAAHPPCQAHIRVFLPSGSSSSTQSVLHASSSPRAASPSSVSRLLRFSSLCGASKAHAAILPHPRYHFHHLCSETIHHLHQDLTFTVSILQLVMRLESSRGIPERLSLRRRAQHTAETPAGEPVHLLNPPYFTKTGPKRCGPVYCGRNCVDHDIRGIQPPTGPLYAALIRRSRYVRCRRYSASWIVPVRRRPTVRRRLWSCRS